MCIIFTFAEDEAQRWLYLLDNSLDINSTFTSLVALIMSIISYIGFSISFYIFYRQEKYRKERLAKDRINLGKIHEELKAMGALNS
jgi:type III secretory pathway component EscU